MKIVWESKESEILLNPRLPSEEQRRLVSLFKSFPDLPGHFWISSSGSTGQSRWIALSKKAILCSAAAVNQHLKSNERDVWLHALPSFHVGGLGIWARSYLSGSKVVDFQERFSKWNSSEFHAALIETNATLSALVPAQLYDLVYAGLSSPQNLRAVIIGGGALNEALYKEARKLDWNILPSYGLSECASQVATAPLISCNGEGSFGLEILPHVRCRTGEDGLLKIRSEALLTGYAWEQGGRVEYRDPKVNGWLTTEDLGEISGGFLKIIGRKGSFVKMGGESVVFAKLENLFEEIRLNLKLSSEVALLAVPDQRMGALTHLFCLDDQKIDLAVDEFNRRVLPFERIRKVHRLSELPKSPLGKILKTELLKQVQ